MLRVLAIHRYVWPDSPPYASLLPAIAAHWAREGHEVEVWSTQPSYQRSEVPDQPSRQHIDGVGLRRFWVCPERTWSGRVLNAGWFPLLIAVRILLGRRRDVVMCSTMPPVVLGWAVSMAARLRGARFVYHCMDLHPEIGRLSGEFRWVPALSLLAQMELATCSRADRIVVLSEDMRRSVERRSPDLAAKVVVIPNFELPGPVPVIEDTRSDHARMRIVFTGNIGRFQNLEALVALVLDPFNGLGAVDLVLMGDGVARPALEAQVADAPVEARSRVSFVDRGSVAAAKALMATADLGLVSLAPGVIRYAYPSKTSTYLEAGLPLLVVCEKDSDLVTLLVREGVGVRLPMENRVEAAATLLALANRRDEMDAMAARARGYWLTSLSASRVLPRWSELLHEVARSAPVRAAHV